MIDSQRLESIVSEAGRIAYDLWPGAGNALDAWEKKPGDPVCEADLAVDAFLKRELGALLPSAGWLSEETADDRARLGHDLIWLVDPVDGTRDFIRGRSGWAVSVALIGGAPLIGTLCARPRETWQAVAGQGAFRNGQRLTASMRRELPARVPACCPRPTPTWLRSKQFDALRIARSPRTRPIWSPPCAGVRMGHRCRGNDRT